MTHKDDFTALNKGSGTSLEIPCRALEPRLVVKQRQGKDPLHIFNVNLVSASRKYVLLQGFLWGSQEEITDQHEYLRKESDLVTSSHTSAICGNMLPWNVFQDENQYNSIPVGEGRPILLIWVSVLGSLLPQTAGVLLLMGVPGGAQARSLLRCVKND